MSELVLPTWINKHNELKEAICGHAETLKEYAGGTYGDIENTARFLCAQDSAYQAMDDLAAALKTVRPTMMTYASVCIDTNAISGECLNLINRREILTTRSPAY